MGRVFGLLFNLFLWGIVVAIPLLGMWFGSSLAAYWNGPTWLAIAVGLLFFPILPITWELRFVWKKRGESDEAKQERSVTWGDRLILRTLLINLIFVGGLLYCYPQVGFTALSTRGDWMLEGREGPEIERARRLLFWTADRLEWLYLVSRDNPYRDPDAESDDLPEIPPPPPKPKAPVVPTEVPDTQGGVDGDGDVTSIDSGDDVSPGSNEGGDHGGSDTAPVDSSKPADPEPTIVKKDSLPPLPRGPPVGKTGVWPLPAVPHPAAVAALERKLPSINAVARHVIAEESDPLQRFKALHDYVALRVAYDHEILSQPPRTWPSQDAETVFKTGKGVCSGYSKLLRALGKAAGFVVVYVTGDSRDGSGDVGGIGHAWNAVNIAGAWYLVDVTWNAGHVSAEKGFQRAYRTDYLFTPPEVFVTDHYPDRESLQFLAEPLSRGEFMRRPMMQPAFHAAGLALVSPTRSQVTLAPGTPIRIANPQGVFFLAKYMKKGASSSQRAKITPGREVQVQCDFPERGTYKVELYVSRERYGTYTRVGTLEVNTRG